MAKTEAAAARLSGPGDRHRLFAPMIGTWRIAMSTRPNGGEAIRSDDLRATKLLFGDGRYVREEVSGTFAGKPHEKLTVLGFNNVRGRYEYATADNNDAVVLLYTSLPGADLGDGRRIETYADYVYAGDGAEVAGTLVTVRTVIQVESEDRHSLRNYYRAPGRDGVRLNRQSAPEAEGGEV